MVEDYHFMWEMLSNVRTNSLCDITNKGFKGNISVVTAIGNNLIKLKSERGNKANKARALLLLA